MAEKGSPAAGTPTVSPNFDERPSKFSKGNKSQSSPMAKDESPSVVPEPQGRASKRSKGNKSQEVPIDQWFGDEAVAKNVGRQQMMTSEAAQKFMKDKARSDFQAAMPNETYQDLNRYWSSIKLASDGDGYSQATAKENFEQAPLNYEVVRLLSKEGVMNRDTQNDKKRYMLDILMLLSGGIRAEATAKRDFNNLRRIVEMCINYKLPKVGVIKRKMVPRYGSASVFNHYKVLIQSKTDHDQSMSKQDQIELMGYYLQNDTRLNDAAKTNMLKAFIGQIENEGTRIRKDRSSTDKNAAKDLRAFVFPPYEQWMAEAPRIGKDALKQKMDDWNEANPDVMIDRAARTAFVNSVFDNSNVLATDKQYRSARSKVQLALKNIQLRKTQAEHKTNSVEETDSRETKVTKDFQTLHDNMTAKEKGEKRKGREKATHSSITSTINTAWGKHQGLLAEAKEKIYGLLYAELKLDGLSGSGDAMQSLIRFLDDIRYIPEDPQKAVFESIPLKNRDDPEGAFTRIFGKRIPGDAKVGLAKIRECEELYRSMIAHKPVHIRENDKGQYEYNYTKQKSKEKKGKKVGQLKKDKNVDDEDLDGSEEFRRSKFLQIMAETSNARWPSLVRAARLARLAMSEIGGGAGTPDEQHERQLLLTQALSKGYGGKLSEAQVYAELVKQQELNNIRKLPTEKQRRDAWAELLIKNDIFEKFRGVGEEENFGTLKLLTNADQPEELEKLWITFLEQSKTTEYYGSKEDRKVPGGRGSTRTQLDIIADESYEAFKKTEAYAKMKDNLSEHIKHLNLAANLIEFLWNNYTCNVKKQAEIAEERKRLSSARKELSNSHMTPDLLFTDSYMKHIGDPSLTDPKQYGGGYIGKEAEEHARAQNLSAEEQAAAKNRARQAYKVFTDDDKRQGQATLWDGDDPENQAQGATFTDKNKNFGAPLLIFLAPQTGRKMSKNCSRKDILTEAGNRAAKLAASKRIINCMEWTTNHVADMTSKFFEKTASTWILNQRTSVYAANDKDNLTLRRLTNFWFPGTFPIEPQLEAAHPPIDLDNLRNFTISVSLKNGTILISYDDSTMPGVSWIANVDTLAATLAPAYASKPDIQVKIDSDGSGIQSQESWDLLQSMNIGKPGDEDHYEAEGTTYEMHRYCPENLGKLSPFCKMVMGMVTAVSLAQAGGGSTLDAASDIKQAFKAMVVLDRNHNRAAKQQIACGLASMCIMKNLSAMYNTGLSEDTNFTKAKEADQKVLESFLNLEAGTLTSKIRQTGTEIPLLPDINTSIMMSMLDSRRRVEDKRDDRWFALESLKTTTGSEFEDTNLAAMANKIDRTRMTSLLNAFENNIRKSILSTPFWPAGMTVNSNQTQARKLLGDLSVLNKKALENINQRVNDVLSDRVTNKAILEALQKEEIPEISSVHAADLVGKPPEDEASEEERAEYQARLEDYLENARSDALKLGIRYKVAAASFNLKSPELRESLKNVLRNMKELDSLMSSNVINLVVGPHTYFESDEDMYKWLGNLLRPRDEEAPEDTKDSGVRRSYAMQSLARLKYAIAEMDSVLEGSLKSTQALVSQVGWNPDTGRFEKSNFLQCQLDDPTTGLLVFEAMRDYLTQQYQAGIYDGQPVTKTFIETGMPIIIPARKHSGTIGQPEYDHQDYNNLKNKANYGSDHKWLEATSGLTPHVVEKAVEVALTLHSIAPVLAGPRKKSNKSDAGEKLLTESFGRVMAANSEKMYKSATGRLSKNLRAMHDLFLQGTSAPKDTNWLAQYSENFGDLATNDERVQIKRDKRNEKEIYRGGKMRNDDETPVHRQLKEREEKGLYAWQSQKEKGRPQRNFAFTPEGKLIPGPDGKYKKQGKSIPTEDPSYVEQAEFMNKLNETLEQDDQYRTSYIDFVKAIAEHKKEQVYHQYSGSTFGLHEAEVGSRVDAEKFANNFVRTTSRILQNALDKMINYKLAYLHAMFKHQKNQLDVLFDALTHCFRKTNPGKDPENLKKLKQYISDIQKQTVKVAHLIKQQDIVQTTSLKDRDGNEHRTLSVKQGKTGRTGVANADRYELARSAMEHLGLFDEDQIREYKDAVKKHTKQLFEEGDKEPLDLNLATPDEKWKNTEAAALAVAGMGQAAFEAQNEIAAWDALTNVTTYVAGKQMKMRGGVGSDITGFWEMAPSLKISKDKSLWQALSVEFGEEPRITTEEGSGGRLTFDPTPASGQKILGNFNSFANGDGEWNEDERMRYAAAIVGNVLGVQIEDDADIKKVAKYMVRSNAFSLEERLQAPPDQQLVEKSVGYKTKFLRRGNKLPDFRFGIAIQRGNKYEPGVRAAAWQVLMQENDTGEWKYMWFFPNELKTGLMTKADMKLLKGFQTVNKSLGEERASVPLNLTVASLNPENMSVRPPDKAAELIRNTALLLSETKRGSLDKSALNDSADGEIQDWKNKVSEFDDRDPDLTVLAKGEEAISKMRGLASKTIDFITQYANDNDLAMIYSQVKNNTKNNVEVTRNLTDEQIIVFQTFMDNSTENMFMQGAASLLEMTRENKKRVSGAKAMQILQALMDLTNENLDKDYAGILQTGLGKLFADQEFMKKNKTLGTVLDTMTTADDRTGIYQCIKEVLRDNDKFKTPDGGAKFLDVDGKLADVESPKLEQFVQNLSSKVQRLVYVGLAIAHLISQKTEDADDVMEEQKRSKRAQDEVDRVVEMAAAGKANVEVNQLTETQLANNIAAFLNSQDLNKEDPSVLAHTLRIEKIVPVNVNKDFLQKVAEEVVAKNPDYEQVMTDLVSQYADDEKMSVDLIGEGAPDEMTSSTPFTTEEDSGESGSGMDVEGN